VRKEGQVLGWSRLTDFAQTKWFQIMPTKVKPNRPDRPPTRINPGQKAIYLKTCGAPPSGGAGLFNNQFHSIEQVGNITGAPHC
jgi:hypothetical protein